MKYMKWLLLSVAIVMLTACGGGSSNGGNDGGGDGNSDTSKPVITLNGANTIELTQGTAYTELGATATDDRDATVSVTVSGSVDVDTVGAYTITYSAIDSAGNVAISITRTINVVLLADTIKPVITLNGASSINLTKGTAYTELGATATDDRDATVTVTVSGIVDVDTVGAYTITYKAKDTAGNEASVIRMVNVLTPSNVVISPPFVQKTTIKGAVDNLIIGATVKLLSLENNELQTATTDSNGSYSMEVDNTKITDGFILEATGGTMNGIDFNDTLRAIYRANEDIEKANITLVTTLVAKMAIEDNTINRSGTLLDKRDEALQKLSDMGMLKKSDWFKVEPSLVNMDELRSVVQGDGLDIWLNNMIIDLADSELGSDKMRVFSNTHGGISKVYIAPDKFVSIFPGQEKRIIVDADFVDTNDTNITIQKISGPDWITIQGNALLITPQSDLTTYNDFTVQLEILANDVQIGRTKNVIVSLVKKVVLLSGELGVEGGKIENQWKDISLSVDANKLTQTYQIEYNAGLTNNGHLALWFKTNPTMTNSDEELSLELMQPSYELIKRNYLENNTSSTSSLRSMNRAVYDTNYASASVPSECRPIKRNVSNEDQSEMVWTDENGDDFMFEYVWQGNIAPFNSNHDPLLPLRKIGGLPRLNGNWTSVNGKTPQIKCSSALRSRFSSAADIEGKEAILFVHGFINTGELGGYDHGGGGDDHKKPGGEYFDDFPRIVEGYEVDGREFEPFIFQWRTNQKFQAVADDLGRSIQYISEKTGKKVHILAHSFGGVLVRTLIQGLSSSNLYHGDFSERYIATLTTVGTPHSGTFGSKRTPVEFDNEGEVLFPEGRHGEGLDVIPSGFFGAPAGAGIAHCQAITCYQTGSGKSYGTRLGGKSSGVGDAIIYGTRSNAGLMAYKQYKQLSSYPNIPTQILIGLVPETISANLTLSKKKTISYDFMDNEASTNPGAGDYLISIFGQRLIPDSDQSNLDDIYLEGMIEEHILPMDQRWNTFFPGVDDGILSYYSFSDINGGIYSWDIPEYRNDVEISDFKFFANGFNHRTGEYETGSEYMLSKKIKRESEVGLQGCVNYLLCENSTWHYFKYFLDDHIAQLINPPEKIALTGDVEYRGVVDTQLANASITRGINRSTSTVPFPVTIEAYTGSTLLATVSTNERTTLKDDGTYELNVTYSPDTNYTVIAYPEGDTFARIGAFVRASASKFLTTFGTLEESTLHFPTITLTDDNYQEGNLSIKVTDGTSGTVLNGFDAEILNSTGINVDEDNSLGINTGYRATVAKGDYTVKISKEGYNDGEAECTVVGNETTECIVNIVSSAVIANGQITAVLSWGATPSDLDSHLVRKTNGSQDYHVYYSNRNGVDSNLDRDDTSSYGPETITINNVNQDSVYTYYVYNFSGGAGSILPNSGAKLELNFDGGQRTFYVPNEEGRYWKVFEIENGRIIPCTSGCVQGNVSGIVRSLDKDDYLFNNLPSK